MSPARTHQLHELVVDDPPRSWAAAGFDVIDSATIIGNTRVQLTGGGEHGGRGITSAAIDDVGVGSVDGVTLHRANPALAPGTHSNHVDSIDHLVVMSPDCDRTTTALEQLGIEARRVRTFEMGGAVRRQTFFWLGDVILELVGADAPEGDGPATLWGLALNSADLDATAANLGPRCSPPKPAVQPGRRICTVKTRDLGISTALAVMSPHPGAGAADGARLR